MKKLIANILLWDLKNTCQWAFIILGILMLLWIIGSLCIIIPITGRAAWVFFNWPCTGIICAAGGMVVGSVVLLVYSYDEVMKRLKPRLEKAKEND